MPTQPTSCTLPLALPNNDQCLAAATPIGKQVTGLLVQDARGVVPTFTTLASIQAALTATTNNGLDQLFILPNLSNGLVPDATDETLSGNAVPYGGEVITGRTHKVTAELIYLDPAGVAAADKFTARQAPVRYWFYDDQNLLQGPFENASLVLGVLKRQGIGNASPVGKALTATTRLPGLLEPAINPVAIAGINALRNV